MRALKLGAITAVFLTGGICLGTPASTSSEPMPIRDLIKPKIYQRVIHDREVMSHAALDDAAAVPKTPGLKRYSFYASMLVKASPEFSRKILTDYRLYSQMIPYVERTEFEPKTKTLALEGGIWKFRLISSVQFEEKNDRWIHFKIVGGHFRGLEGDLLFESSPDKLGTVVLMQGEQLGLKWPPQFVIERGAEIVFSFTADRMRRYIEDQKRNSVQGGTKPDDNSIPQPRRRL